MACLTTGTARAVSPTKNGGPHWGRYRWSNQVVSTDRVFWLVDRTGNVQMHKAILQWVQSWNNQRNLNVKSAPLVLLTQDDANIGQSRTSGRRASRSSPSAPATRAPPASPRCSGSGPTWPRPM